MPGVGPSNFTEARGLGGPAQNDPYNDKFARTDAGSAMSSMIKNGSLDFGDLKSGSSAGFKGGTPNITSDKLKQISPRSPVSRKEKSSSQDR